jgi:hypothetical protein
MQRALRGWGRPACGSLESDPATHNLFPACLSFYPFSAESLPAAASKTFPNTGTVRLFPARRAQRCAMPGQPCGRHTSPCMRVWAVWLCLFMFCKNKRSYHPKPPPPPPPLKKPCTLLYTPLHHALSVLTPRALVCPLRSAACNMPAMHECVRRDRAGESVGGRGGRQPKPLRRVSARPPSVGASLRAAPWPAAGGAAGGWLARRRAWWRPRRRACSGRRLSWRVSRRPARTRATPGGGRSGRPG